MDKSSKIVSISHLRNLREQATRKEYLDVGDRVRELEADLFRLIEMSIEMENRLFNQERYITKLVGLLKKHS